MNYLSTPKWDIRRFLAELDGWKCQICKTTLSPNARWGWDNPDWWTDDFPVLDHIKPKNNSPGISRKKLHHVSNLRLTCMRCNLCRFALDCYNKYPEWTNKIIPQLDRSQFTWREGSDPYNFVEGSSLIARRIKPKVKNPLMLWWKQVTFEFRREIL